MRLQFRLTLVLMSSLFKVYLFLLLGAHFQ